MKLSEIITRVQRQFGDDVQAQITEEDIVRWVNDACLEIVTNNDTAEGFIGNTPVVAGKHWYDMPSDLIRIRSVRVNGFKLKAESYEQLCEEDPDIETTTGQPTAYWVYSGKINLYPIPNDSLGNLNILYVKTPDVITTAMKDRQPDVPIQYHPRIVEYCIAQAAELDDNFGFSQSKMQQFNQNLLGLKQNSEQPESNGIYPSITYVGELW
jgi:hypothetical protein